MKAGTETGSLMNHVMTSGSQAEPKVGDGATVCFWTDRVAGTIIKITRCQIHVQEDLAKRVDNNGMSESQHYAYTPNPNGHIHVFRMTKRGWKSGTNGLTIGVRRQHYDYSF